MSAQIQYGSEMIDKLPLSNDPLQPLEYARIVPLLDESYRLTRPLQHYLIVMVLFILLSLGFVDRLILGYAPQLGNMSFALVVIKAVAFAMILYMIDFFMARTQKS